MQSIHKHQHAINVSFYHWYLNIHKVRFYQWYWIIEKLAMWTLPGLTWLFQSVVSGGYLCQSPHLDGDKVAQPGNWEQYTFGIWLIRFIRFHYWHLKIADPYTKTWQCGQMSAATTDNWARHLAIDFDPAMHVLLTLIRLFVYGYRPLGNVNNECVLWICGIEKTAMSLFYQPFTPTCNTFPFGWRCISTCSSTFRW